MVKVVLLTPEYPPYSGGGVGSLSYELARGLSRVGVEVVVVTRCAGVMNTMVDMGDYKVYYLASPPIPPKDVWYYTLRMGSVKSVLVDEKPDVIHDLGVFSAFQPWITRLAPTVCTVQGSPQLSTIRRSIDWRDGLRDVLFEVSHRLQPLIMGVLMKPDVRFWVYVSRFAMFDSLRRVRDEGLRRDLMDRSTVIYNGVGVRALRAIGDYVVKSDGADSYSITFIGRLMEYKGIRFLIKAFRHVVSELREAKLNVIGDGPKYGEVWELVRKLGLEGNVILHGALPRTKALKILAKSTILTHPSLYESFGMVIAEAYAMGKPVVTHKAGYAKELVEEPRAGLTVNVLNELDYARALITMLSDKGLYRKLAYNALEFAMRRLDVGIMARDYVNVYRRVLEHA
jgi:glycosyltransferase involved in cell wall biosynthesis